MRHTSAVWPTTARTPETTATPPITGPAQPSLTGWSPRPSHVGRLTTRRLPHIKSAAAAASPHLDSMTRPPLPNRRQPLTKSAVGAGSAHFDFLAGTPAAGTPPKKLVRIARTPKRPPPSSSTWYAVTKTTAPPATSACGKRTSSPSNNREPTAPGHIYRSGIIRRNHMSR